MIQQWDFPVDEPVSLPAYRRRRVDDSVAIIAERIRTGTSIRALADEFGVSREAIRRTLAHTGVVTEVEKEPQPSLPLRRVRAYRLTGRGRSRAFTPAEVTELLRRHSSGESVRSRARARDRGLTRNGQARAGRGRPQRREPSERMMSGAATDGGRPPPLPSSVPARRTA